MANRNRRKLIPYGSLEYPHYYPGFHGSITYSGHQQASNPYRLGFSGSQWNQNHDFTLARHPHFINHSRQSFGSSHNLPNDMRRFQTDSNYDSREEYTRDDFNMTNDQFHYKNVRSNQFDCLDSNGQPAKVPSYIAANKWQQAGAKDPDVSVVSGAPTDVKPGKPQIHGAKGLMKGLSQPVEADKAQRMMARMGWCGGALGCNRDGLTEPLMPNLLLQKGAGLGHRPPAPAPPKPRVPQIPAFIAKTDPLLGQIISLPVDVQTTQVLLNKLQKKQLKLKKIQKKGDKKLKNQRKQAVGRGIEGVTEKGWKVKRDMRGDPGSFPDYYAMTGQRPHPKTMRRRLPPHLQTDILNKIFSFVTDPKQDKMAFDKTLTKTQRAYIHFLTEAFRETNGVVYDGCLDSEAQAKTVEAICESNSYVLTSESIGVGEERQIYLYKEPPDHMYLITKDDITFCPEADNENDDGDTGNDKVIIIDDDFNDSQELEYEELGDDEMCTVDEVKNEFGDEFNEKDNIIDNSEHNMILNEIKNESNNYSNYVDTIKTETVTEDTDTNIKVDSYRDNMVNYHPIAEEKDKIESDDITKNTETAKIYSNIENIACGVIENDPKKNETKYESIMEREEQIRKLLLEFFKEFFEDTKYTEMRFLGDFDETQENAIVKFVTEIEKCVDDINNCKNLVKEGENWLVPIFCNKTYKLMTMANTDGYSDNIIEKALRNNPDELKNEIIFETSMQPYGSS